MIFLKEKLYPEGTGEMHDFFRSLPLPGGNRHHVETATLTRDVVLLEIVLSGPDNLSLLPPVHGKLGREMISAIFGLYLHENQKILVSGDDIDFSQGAAVVSGRDFEPFLLEKPGGFLLPPVPQS
jgi:hypothetical protein